LQVGFSRAGEEYETLRHSAYIIIDARIATADGRWPIEPVIDRSRPSIAGGIHRTHARMPVRACVRSFQRAFDHRLALAIYGGFAPRRAAVKACIERSNDRRRFAARLECSRDRAGRLTRTIAHAPL